MSKNITEKNKFEGGKTRIQSLKDRIDIAFETLRNLYDESKLEKINQKEKRPSKTKIIQYDLEEVANKIVSKEGTVNLKTLEAKIMPTDENNIEESKEQLNTKEIEINSPFINRMQFILNELNDAFGTEYTLTDGIISKYNELSGSIDNLILKKRSNSLDTNKL